MRRWVSVVLVLGLVLSSVAPVAATAGNQSSSASTVADRSSPATTVRPATVRPAATDAGGHHKEDPPSDTIGWEDGYWYDEQISVDQSDGLSDAELHAMVARAMARVEYIRKQEFTSTVPVEVISRSEFRQQSSNGSANSSNSSFGEWNNQVWEALFVTGENTDVQQELQGAYGSSIAGFYSPADDEIKIVTDTPDRPVIDNATLVHELTHALQDQTRDFNASADHEPTQDGGLAVDGVVEGEANYVEHAYSERCGDEWQCVSTPDQRSSGSQGRPNLGILLTLYQPYSDGPVYVDWLRKNGGWKAVNERFSNPPKSTEQVIHRTDEKPTPIAYEDYATNGWRTFPKQGENGSDTVGEASMYVMFWYQARTNDANTVPVRSISRTDGPLDTYNYNAKPSAGWGNDRVFPYRKATDSGTKYGYVWVTEWDTERDASQFVDAYRNILDAHDATRAEEGVYVIPDGPFADAFRIDRSGTRVTIVNAPTKGDLGDVRPADSGEASSTAAESGNDGSGGGTGSQGDGGSGLSGPGFGVPAALTALAAVVALALRRRR